MFCTKCGKQNSDDTKFCVACSNLLKQSSNTAPLIEKKELKVEIPVTEPEGNKASIFCTKCGKQNPNGTKFCVTCGNPLTQLSSPAPAIAIKEQETAKQVEIKQPLNPVIEKREIKVETLKDELVKSNSAFHTTPAESSNVNLKSKTLNTETVQPQNNAIASPRKKKTGIVITVILLFALIAGGAGYWYYMQRQSLRYFSKEYAGNVQNQPATLKIVRQGYVVSGIMRFPAQPALPSITLQGTVSSENDFSLYPPDMSIIIKGKFVDVNTIRGTISNKKETHGTPFTLATK